MQNLPGNIGIWKYVAYICMLYVYITCVCIRMRLLRMQRQMQGASHLATSPASLARLDAEDVRGRQGELPGDMPCNPQGHLRGRSRGELRMAVRQMQGASHLHFIAGDSQGQIP